MAPHLRVATLIAVLLAAPAAQAQSLADAWKIIQGKEFVDLTQTFGAGTPVWAGFGQAAMSAAADPKTHEPYTIPKHGFRTTFYAMVGQYGTHIDPPAHFAEGGITMDKIPVKQMMLPLVVFDATPLLAAEPDRAWSVADIEAWERRHGPVPRGSFAALRTDMSKDWEADPARFKRHPFPGWSLAALKLLFEERGVTAIGHESLDTDATATLEGETWLLRAGHWQIEVMANLDRVPATGALIVVAWPKVENGLGFPARAFAILP